MPGKFKFDFGRTEFYTVPIQDVTNDDLAICQDVTRNAMWGMPDRTPREVDAYVQYGDLPAYIETRRNPQLLVERGEFNRDQIIKKPYITFAMHDSEAMGFAYVADTVSGSSAMKRQAKQLIPRHNYLFVREMAVRPEWQRQGVGLMLGYAALQRVAHRRPVSMYMLDELCDEQYGNLRKLGFVEHGLPKEATVFGEGSRPTRVHSMLARHAGTVLFRIGRIAGANDALTAAGLAYPG